MSAQGTTGSAMGSARQAGNSDALENLARVGPDRLRRRAPARRVAGPPAGLVRRRRRVGRPVRRDVHRRRVTGRQAPAVGHRGRPDRAGRRGRPPRCCAGAAAGRPRARPARRRSGSPATRWSRPSIYIALAVLAIRFATGGGQSSSQQQQETTAGVFGWPGGQFLVGAAGLILIGSGVWHVCKGVTKRFLKQIDTSEASPKALRLVTRLGQVGFPGKGIALAAGRRRCSVWAAVTFDPSKAQGLDGALRTDPRAALRPDPADPGRPRHRRVRCVPLRAGPLPRAHLSGARRRIAARPGARRRRPGP